MNKIKAFITIKNDPSVGIMPEYYTMELPDFREYEPDYTEQNRKTIKTFYWQLADSDCHVVFDFEVPGSMR
jgi:hypothetical protein